MKICALYVHLLLSTQEVSSQWIAEGWRGSNEQQRNCPFFELFPYAFAAASLEMAPGPEGPLWMLVCV